MFGAASTHGDKLLFQCLPGPVNSHGCVAGSDAGLRSKGVKSALVQIDLAEYLAVGSLQGRENIPDALADDTFGCGIGGWLSEQVVGPAAQCTIFCVAMTVVVDHGVAQYPVKPRDRGFIATQRRRLLERTRVGALQNIFCGGRRVDPSLNEAQELATLVEQVRDDFRGHKECAQSKPCGAEGRFRAT